MEEEVKRRIAVPYMENKAIMVFGDFVHPSKIVELHIFKSQVPYERLILPNGKPANEQEDHFYVLKCLSLRKVNGVGACTFDFITSPPQAKEESKKMSIRLMESAGFLGLDDNWSLATCALQLQEVAVTLVAKRKKIRLDKTNVERVLNQKIQTLSFNDQYQAFSTQVNALSGSRMPILTTHLRRMRAKVLHEGYNPNPEETEAIASFTIGLLEKLKHIT